MNDNFTERTHNSLLGNLGNSFIGALVGLILFFASFVVLYMNEGRIDLSTIAKDSTNINSDTIQTQDNGKLINTYNNIKTDNLIGDSQFILPGKYLALNRNVENYVWVEQTNTKTTNNAGGSSDTETTYNYVKQWTSSIPNSDNFKVKEGHSNKFDMTKNVESMSVLATGTKIGAYNVDLSDITLPPLSNLSIDNNVVAEITLKSKANQKDNGIDYIYISNNGISTLSNPEIGDQRVFYSYLPNDAKSYTLIGQTNGDSISKYNYKDISLFRLFDSNFDEAINTLHSENQFITWVVRAAGFFMMWIGLMMIVGPLIALSRIIPFFGGFVNGLTGAVALLIALILSVITILISMILHNIIALVILLIIAILILVSVFRKR